MASDKIIHLSEDDFDNGISSGLTLVDFWAEWCAPCLALAPTMDELADSYADKLTVAKVNIDSNPGIPVKFGIRGIPTIILFKDGEQVDMFVGNSPQKIKEMVENAV
ncbi:MAG: thioredoxin [SAR324 cluster bacterium]|nr:thioredoxin [SAR324 cluster bacterium]MCZ6531533.1 thioredoxin [SAR324 cluster bacterium]MCZ6557248.1 thioredoxin [SAR324 cluster bacterium]MCZ6626983.1 thioredoxin [SAR324 cluster bacterium]MCZ6645509.1 thioredoxin [SAR324 cluster bacterium]